jgi:hypothetical protein
VSPDIRVRGLADTDRVAEFDCGAEQLNDWLRRYAHPSADLESARTHVALSGDGAVRGYVALTAGAVEHRDATRGMSEGGDRAQGRLSSEPHQPTSSRATPHKPT